MKKLKHSLIIVSLGTCILFVNFLRSYDFPHFYRASYFFGEPRLQKDKLTSIDITIAGGSTRKSRNCAGNTVCLFDIYGPSNMQKLGAGIPDKDPTNPADIALIYLENLPSRDCFGFLSYGGKFSLVETIFSLTQNISNGFFVQFLMPFKHMKVSDICCTDLSPTDGTYPNKNNPYWQLFLNQFNTILAKYGLYLGEWKETDFGDVSMLLGFAYNYQETMVLDYIDFSAKCGIIIPSGRERSLNRVFDIPSGYDGHTGIPLQLDAAIGLFDWFTIGAHGDVIPFLSKTTEVRMKTDYNQCGPIKLAKGCALVKQGVLFDLGAYIKADHFARGCSLLIGYSYNKKYKDKLTPQDRCLFDPCIVNSDPILYEWDMHTLHVLAEYDFAKDNKRFCPRISLFYNWQFAGKNVFKNNTAGGTFGFDMAWEY